MLAEDIWRWYSSFHKNDVGYLCPIMVGLKLIADGKESPTFITIYAWIGTIKFAMA